jgi:hypothetical protein
VPQARHRANLTVKQPDAFVACRIFPPQDFQRHASLGLSLLCLIHDTHAPATDFANNVKLADERRRWGGRQQLCA